MNTVTSNKIREQFATMAIYKDPLATNSLFAGRNLPSFVKDFLLKRYINPDGSVDRLKLTSFLDIVIPKESTDTHTHTYSLSHTHIHTQMKCWTEADFTGSLLFLFKYRLCGVAKIEQKKCSMGFLRKTKQLY